MLVEELFLMNEFDDIIDDLNRIIREILRSMMDGEGLPAIYGFSVVREPGEEPKIVRIDKDPEELLSGFFGMLRMQEPPIEPVVELFEDEDKVYVNAEVPDIKEDSIILNFEGDVLRIHGFGKASKGIYTITTKLPCKVDKSDIDISVKHGILEVVLRKQSE